MADLTPSPESPPDDLLGRILEGKYRIEERLGGGGMGTVYRATQLLTLVPVALKVMNARHLASVSARERFRREALAAGRIRHPNAVQVTDFGQTSDGLVYLVMQLLEGSTLKSVLASEAPFDAARAVSLMLEVTAAVAAAHQAGVIHRDLKPDNIFIVQKPDVPRSVKVLDFGIAKLAINAKGDGDEPSLTGTGAVLGTPRYMSPEQCNGTSLTPAADVYSLGVILYECLTGVVPFSDSAPVSLALKHAREKPRPPREIVPSIPPELETLVLRSLEKDPAERPANAGILHQELLTAAERLGLEHASGITGPTMEDLSNLGTRTPSGRLVIDIERLRQIRAASLVEQNSSAGNGRLSDPPVAGQSSIRTSSGPLFQLIKRLLWPRSGSGSG